MPGTRPQRRSSALRVRVAIFAVLAIAVAGGATFALWPKTLATSDIEAVDLTMRVDMGGFTPPMLTAQAGRPIRIRMVNPDGSHHSDGGGVHGFTVPGLGIDARIQPESTQVVTILLAKPGEYPFYCDTCCGGKENPSMQGMLMIKA